MSKRYGPLHWRFMQRATASVSTAAAFSVAVRKLAAAHGFDERSSAFLELAVFEVCTNVVRHGYSTDQPGPLKLIVELFEHALRVRILDRGRPVPTERIEAASVQRFEFDSLDLENLPESGMGLALICLAVDTVAYRRRNGWNRFDLVKNRS